MTTVISKQTAFATPNQCGDKRNIHSLSAQECKELYRNEYKIKSRFQSDFGADNAEIEIGNFAETFRSEVMRLLADKQVINGNETLEKLHETLPQEMKDYGFNDGVNKITTFLYDTDDTFATIYLSFIKDVVSKHFPYPFYFQATPTIRLHCPKGKHNDHYPRYHTDIGYGHPPQEINIWLPLTQPQAPQQHGFRSLNVQHSKELLEQFDYNFTPFIDKAINDKPFNYSLNEKSQNIATPLGKMIGFDSRCIHTGEPMEHHTRASMDIRIIAIEDFKNMPVEYQGTGRRRILYLPGECYHTLSSDKL